ncbi:hypothetical protein KPH14_003006 [Odynerus spinipes]|uniref:Uncharacterized protein n=1 Tax=Odynerus spinipes TaxID=1348599 RepID=A0AAD9RWQ4_9HYME|nr:hypothetical protein KPH14_003006 [Odynerus spinipes]
MKGGVNGCSGTSVLLSTMRDDKFVAAKVPRWHSECNWAGMTLYFEKEVTRSRLRTQSSSSAKNKDNDFQCPFFAYVKEINVHLGTGTVLLDIGTYGPRNDADGEKEPVTILALVHEHTRKGQSFFVNLLGQPGLSIGVHCILHSSMNA